MLFRQFSFHSSPGSSPSSEQISDTGGLTAAGSLLQAVCCRLSAAGYLLQAFYCRLSAAGSLLQAVCCRLSVAGSLSPVCRLHEDRRRLYALVFFFPRFTLKPFFTPLAFSFCVPLPLTVREVLRDYQSGHHFRTVCQS